MSDGAPNGVSILHSVAPRTVSILYKPLPPIIPIPGDSFFISESLRDLLRKTEKMESG
jgi:hypothetical protein